MDEKIQKNKGPILKLFALTLGSFGGSLLWGDINTLSSSEAEHNRNTSRMESRQYLKELSEPVISPVLQTKQALHPVKQPLHQTRTPSSKVQEPSPHVRELRLIPGAEELLSEVIFSKMSWDERDRYLKHLSKDQLMAFYTGLSQEGKGEYFKHLPYYAKKFCWKWLDPGQKGRYFGYIPSSDLIHFFNDLNEKWRDLRIYLLPESDQFKVLSLLSAEGKKKYLDNLSPEKRTRLMSRLTPEEQANIPALITDETLLQQWDKLSPEEQERRFPELPPEKRKLYWLNSDKRVKKYHFKNLSEPERIECWSSFKKDEDSQKWNFQYLPRDKRLDLWPNVSYEVRRCNFQSFSDAERVELWSDLNELSKGVNFQYLPLSVCARFWPDLSERWRSSNFRWLRKADRVRFWGTLAHLESHPNAQTENFQYLPEDARLAAWEGRILDGKIFDHRVQEGLTQDGRDRNFGYLPQEVRLEHWNELSSEGKTKNYWYLTPEQRQQLRGLLDEDAELDQRRFELWPMWKKTKFWKRIEASFYNSYSAKRPQSLLPIDQLVYEDDAKSSIQYSMNPKSVRSSSHFSSIQAQ